MKSLKKTLVLLVVLSMILSAVSPVFAFSDVIPEEYAEQANKMAAFGVFSGDEGTNEFNAEREITRAEMAVIIGKLMGLTDNEAIANKGYASNFSDVAAGDWYTGWVNLVAGRGIISGFPDGTFRPNEKVTQAQAVTMIVKALGWGVVVDQTGTWPANYITKASELRLFKNAVETNSELVTRGNVAIYCYNALTADTWDVTSSTDGKLTSSKDDTATILEKYFSDFVNEDGEMKLVEGVQVVGTPITNSELGVNQVELKGAYDETDPTEALEVYGSKYQTIAAFLKLKGTVKNAEEKTYGSENEVTAYVLESACDNVATLYGKTVDVIFGKDNKVAYIAVTDDAADGIVTAWDNGGSTPADAIIEIDGEEYEFASTYSVNVFGNLSTEGIDEIFTELGVTDPERKFDRTVKANIVLDEDGDIKSINFIFAGNYDGTEVDVNEYVVRDVSSKGKIAVVDGGSDILSGTYESLEDEVRVIKNNEIVSLEEIVEGDVITVVTTSATTTVYVSDARAEGEITRLKNTSYTLDDADVYYTAKGIIADSNGDIEKAEAVTDSTNTLKSYFGEEVEFYLNFMGEVTAMVANSESVDETLGIVAKVGTDRYDDDKEVSFYQVRILTEEGTKTYKIYNKDAEEDWNTGDDAVEFTDGLAAGDIVIFSADANRIIKSDDIIRVDSGDTEVTIGSTTVDVVELTTVTAVSNNKKKVTQDDVDYKFAGATLYNNNYNGSSTPVVDDIEVISGWSTICNDDTDATAFNGYAGKAFVKQNTGATSLTVLYYVAALEPATDYVKDDAQYAVLVDIEYDVEDDEEIYIATLYVDGEEVSYEIAEDQIENANNKDFVKFELSDDKVVTLTKLVDVYEFAKLEDIEDVASTEVAGLTLTHKALLEVEKVYDTYVEFITEYNCGDEDCDHTSAADLDISEDGYVIYDLRDGYEMYTEELSTLEGEYVYGFAPEGEDGCVVFVILD